jgi:hypothetical protein
MQQDSGSRNGEAHNSGIQAGGDITVDHGAIATGGGSATVTHSPTGTGPDAQELTDTLRELREAAHELLAQLRTAEDELEDGAELVDAAERLTGELERDEPRPNKLLQWLGFITPGVQAAGELAAATAGITTTVQALM